MKINEAYFGVGTRDFNTGEMTFWNLFANGRVKWSVAKYITMTNEMKKTLLSDPLHFCFGDVQGRCEYEFVVCPWGGLDENDKVVDVGEKVDVFKMYVEPNADYLMKIVDSISVISAKEYLRDERKKLKVKG